MNSSPNRPAPPALSTTIARGRFGAAARIGRRIRQAPLSTAFVLLLWTIGAWTGSLKAGPPQPLMSRFGTGVGPLGHLRLDSTLTSALFTSGLSAYLLATAMAAGIGVFIEPRWGSLRLFWVAAVSQILGTAIGIEMIRLLAAAGSGWADGLRTDIIVGPWPLLLGVIVAYSAAVQAPWRLRIRLSVFVVVAALALYSGYLEDVVRFTSACVGLLLAKLLSTTSTVRTPRAIQQEARTLIAGILVATAVGPVITAFNHRATGPLSVLHYLFVSPQLNPGDLADLCGEPNATLRCAEAGRELRFHGAGPAVMSLLPVMLVLLVAYGLRKGRRSAWWSALVLHGLLAILGLVSFLEWNPREKGRTISIIQAHSTQTQLLPLLVPLVIVLALLSTRRLFRIPAPAGTYRQLARTFAVAVVVIAAVYILGGSLLSNQFNPSPTVWDLIQDFPRRLAPPGYLGLVSLPFLPTTTPATLLFEWSGVLVWGVAGLGLLRAFHREAVQDPHLEVSRARQIVHHYGHNALSYLTLWDGNRYWFNASGSSFVAYRVVSAVAIVVGDPIGPEHETEASVTEFIRFSVGQGWTTCFYSATERLRDIGATAGWPSVEVAQEAYLPLGHITFGGKRFQDIRTAGSRAAREGITTGWLSFPTAPAEITQQIIELSREWIASKGLPEMGFTLGGIDELNDPEVRCLVAIGADGTVHGITSWLPVYQDGVPIAWTLDYLRRGTNAFKGVMEFLISTAAIKFQEEGAQFVSLSGAPLARLAAQDQPVGLQRLLERTGRTLEPVYGFRSLLAFKAKFQPNYRPIYLVYPDATALPRIGAAISKAYLPHLNLTTAIRVLRKLRPPKQNPPRRQLPPESLSPAAAGSTGPSGEIGFTP